MYHNISNNAPNKGLNNEPNKGFNKSAKTYAQHADIQPIIAQFVASQAQQYLSEAELILDIGCGAGQLAQFLPNYHIIGVDAAENMCAISPAPVICADALCLPFADATFNAAISSLCWQWLPLPLAAVELKRILQPNAVAIIALLSHGTMWELHDVYLRANIAPRLLDYYKSEQIAEIFKHHDFAIIAHHQQQIVINHDCVWSFFQQLRLIGAHQASMLPPLNYGQLKQIMRIYEREFGLKNDINEVTNNIPVTYKFDCVVLGA